MAKKPTKTKANVKLVVMPHATYEVEFSKHGNIMAVTESDFESLFDEVPSTDILAMYPAGQARDNFLRLIRHAVAQNAEIEHIRRTQGDIAQEILFNHAKEHLATLRGDAIKVLQNLTDIRQGDAQLQKLVDTTLRNLLAVRDYVGQLPRHDSPKPKKAPRNT